MMQLHRRFLARLEAKINSIGVTKTPSPTFKEEERDNYKVNNNDNANQSQYINL